MYNYIIYHKNCIDGFSGFFLFKRLKLSSKDAIIYPDVPSAKNIPPMISNKNVIIIDVAYSMDILEKIFALAKNVLFIDHHITTLDYVNVLAKKYNQKVYFNEKYSAAGLVWKYFYPKQKMPRFVRYIQDNDIGAWKLKYTKEFINAIQVHYKLDPSQKNIHDWENLFDSYETKKLIKLGIHYQKYKNYLLDQNIKRYSLEQFPSERLLNDNLSLKNLIGEIGKYKVALYNGGCPTASSLGEQAMNTVDCDFAFIWNLNLEKKDIIVSLRSKENGVDVSKIAECFGGGGHHGASAFSFSINKYNIQDFFLENSLPR